MECNRCRCHETKIVNKPTERGFWHFRELGSKSWFQFAVWPDMDGVMEAGFGDRYSIRSPVDDMPYGEWRRVESPED